MNQYGLQPIANRLARYLGLTTTPMVEIKPVKRGLAHPKTGKVTIPEWILGVKCRRQAYQKYYVTHEVIHFRIGLKHDSEFKRVEAEVLSKLFVIRICRYYKRRWPWRPPSDLRVYPTTLVYKETWELLWEESTKR